MTEDEAASWWAYESGPAGQAEGPLENGRSLHWVKADGPPPTTLQGYDANAADARFHGTR
jgi:hypothetical protein